MDTSETKPALSALLAGQPVGTWVVLDSDMAHIERTAFDQMIGERPVVIQVPDPSMVCFY